MSYTGDGFNTWVSPNTTPNISPVTQGGRTLINPPIITTDSSHHLFKRKGSVLHPKSNNRMTIFPKTIGMDDLKYEDYHIRGTQMLIEWIENFDGTREKVRYYCMKLERWVIG